MILNIIGNGFDLYHGLPSSYYYFGCFLINHHLDFYERMCESYNIKYQKNFHPIAHDFDYTAEDIFWRDFEKNLGLIDDCFIVDTNITDLNLEYDDYTELDIKESIRAEEIKYYFQNWVENTLDINKNYTLIKKHIKSLKKTVCFGENDYFLQFNYTHSLEKIYGIQKNKIHYIHGECNGDYSELIVGHRNNERIEKIEHQILDLEENFDYSQKSYNNIEEYKCLLNHIIDLKKNVGICRLKSQEFYKKNELVIDTVKIWGLSLGEVDIPYIIDIKKRWKNAKWEFSYYEEAEKDRIKEIALNKIKLNEVNFSFFKFSNEEAFNIKSKIIKLQNIKEW